MFVFPLILGGALLLGITIAVVRQIKKKGMNQSLSYLVVLGAALIFYGLFKGVYKPYGLYENHFKEATGLKFPKTGNYDFADTWIASNESPTSSSISVVKLPAEFKETLIAQLKKLGYKATAAGFENMAYVKKQIDHAVHFTDSEDVIEGYALTTVVDIPKDLYETIERLKKARESIPENIKELDKILEQDYINVIGTDNRIEHVDFVKYYIGFLSDKESAVIYVLHE